MQVKSDLVAVVDQVVLNEDPDTLVWSYSDSGI
jgi:hypothetical protein